MAAGLCALAAVLPLGASAAAFHAVPTIDVAVGRPATGPAVPEAFVGLSFEVTELRLVARLPGLTPLLRAAGPGLMRFGGSSADSGLTLDRGLPHLGMSAGPFTDDDLGTLHRLLLRSGWRAIVALPLLGASPDGVAEEAWRLRHSLGATLAAVEIGNEPNTYWLLDAGSPAAELPGYLAEVAALRRAIAARVPGLPLAGPDTTLSTPPSRFSAFDGLSWLEATAARLHPSLLTAHLYALPGCGAPASVRTLLGPGVARTDDALMTRLARAGRRARLPARLGETNSVACGGRHGVSDTLGGALWALRLELAAMRAGLAGVNFHTLLGDCTGYSAVCVPTPASLRAGQVELRPEWYALALAGRLQDLRPVPARLRPSPPGLSASAFAARGRVALIATASVSPPPGTVLRLHLPSRVTGGMLTVLTAPRIDSVTGLRVSRGRVRATVLGIGHGISSVVSVHLRGPGAVLIELSTR